MPRRSDLCKDLLTIWISRKARCADVGECPASRHVDRRQVSASGRFPLHSEPAIYSLAIAAAGNQSVKGKFGNRSNSYRSYHPRTLIFGISDNADRGLTPAV